MKPWNQLRARLRGASGRSRAVGLFFATSISARALGIACQLLQVPIAMHALGSEAFGLWMTLTGIGAMITLADFGVGQGAQNQLADAFGSGRDDDARTIWDSAMIFFGGIGLLLAAAVAIVVPLVDFTRLFNLSDSSVQAEASAAVAVTLAVFCVGFPLGLAQRLALARQKGWQHNLALAAGSVGGLGGMWMATRLGWGLPAVIAAAQLPLWIATAVLLWRQLADLRWLDLQRTRFQAAAMRELIRLGAHFGIQQVQLTLFLALPQLIISTQLGAAAVTPYNLAQRLFNLFAIIQNAFMLPLWPAYSDAKAKGDFAWIRRTLRTSVGATLGCTLLPMALGAVLARPILELWVGDAASLPSPQLVWLMFLWNALVFLGQPFGYMLAGLSELKRLTQYAVVSSIASFVLMGLLVQRYGQEGVVAGMCLGFLPFLLRGNIVEALLHLRRFPAPPRESTALLETASATETRT